MQFSSNRILIPIFTLILLLGLFGGVLADRHIGQSFIDRFVAPFIPEDILPRLSSDRSSGNGTIDRKVLNEENLVIDVVEQTSPSVVTVGIKTKERSLRGGDFGQLFDPFGMFQDQRELAPEKETEHDIGTGFVVDNGLIVTNKHVVSETGAEYKIYASDGKEYQVEKIYRDVTLDMAILLVKDLDLKPLPLGDSDHLKVGQMAIAIGTALGEFRNTVTTGVVSGIGRSITAGGYGSASEELESVIQTDAAVNPGNSGGPLLNSAGQVIGVNVATSAGAENISFAIPINLVKESIDNFNKTGKFERAFLGVQYKMIDPKSAVMYDLPAGAYLVTVVEDSAAFKAGLKDGDVVTMFDGKKVAEMDGGLAKAISEKKIGESVEVEYWRDGEQKKATVTLGESQ